MNLLEPAPTPFDWNFRLFGTDIRVSGWFWVLPAVFAVMGASSLGPSPLVIIPACFLFSILLHEFGHVVAGREFGADSYIVLNGIGGVAVGCAEVPERWQRNIVFLAGPIAQLLVGIPLWQASDLIERFLLGDADPSHPVYLTLMMLTAINLGWPLFNLLPVRPLDGGQVLRELVGYFRGEDPPPWEQDADWWKRGPGYSPYRSSVRTGRRTFRIRWKLVLPVVAAGVVVAGSVAFREHQSRRRQRALAEFEQIGARVSGDGVGQFFGFDFEGTDIGDEQLALIERFDEIGHLNLAGTRVTDAGLRHLRGLRRLMALYLPRTQVTDAGLEQLQHLTELRVLFLNRTPVTDAGLAHLRPLHNLEYLALAHTRVTDAGLVHLKSLPNLECLELTGSRVSKTGIADLRKAQPSLTIIPQVRKTAVGQVSHPAGPR